MEVHAHTTTHSHAPAHTDKMQGRHSHKGHDHHSTIRDFRKRFIICCVITLPILLLSEMIQHFFNFHISFTGDKYLLFVLSSILFFYGGWPFLKGLKEELSDKNPGMMTLIGMAISVAYVYSSAVVFGLPGMDFFWELATLIDLMLLGHWVEMKSVSGASRSLELLVKMLPSTAHLLHEDHIMDVSIDKLQKGDIILVKPGEKIPADAIITEGQGYVDESMLTGESKPVKKIKNDKLIGGSVNSSGSIKAEVVSTGKQSYLSKVIKMVEDAQKTKSRLQNISHRAARWLTVIALGVGLITLVTWLLLGKEFSFALERMVTVMIISCPHALGLAVPLVVAISTSMAAQKGLLIRNRSAFEESGNITAIVFDKTGTLTKGKFGVTRFKSLNERFDHNEILILAGALESHSEHPIASGIIDKIKSLKLKLPAASHFKNISGKGAEARVDNMAIKVMSPAYLKENNIAVPKDAFTSRAETVVFVFVENDLAGYIALADEIRNESLEAIKTFRKHGIKVLMATGDNKTVAEAVSNHLKLDGYYAEVLPHQKVDIIKDLQDKGEFVAMTGDGVNDAPALAQANIGIAVGSGTDIAAETADIILVNSNPKDILELILFGKATYKKMIQNLGWATAYNAITIPLAAGLLFNYGINLSPAVGAILMSLSTVIVALNAQLLRKF